MTSGLNMLTGSSDIRSVSIDGCGGWGKSTVVEEYSIEGADD